MGCLPYELVNDGFQPSTVQRKHPSSRTLPVTESDAKRVVDAFRWSWTKKLVAIPVETQKILWVNSMNTWDHAKITSR